MLKGNFVIGKPIVERETRQPLGKQVRDAIVVRAEGSGLLRDCDCVVGFWVRGAEPNGEGNILPLGVVSAIDRKGIAVDAESWTAVVESGKFARERQNFANKALARRILTLDGQDLGTASDVYFDPQTGAIEGYETWGGVFADPETGKSFVPATRIVELGHRAVGVASETAERMKERPVEDAAVSRCAPLVSAEMQQKAFVVGKIARERVCTPNGVPLLVPGQLITSAHAAVAQNRGILDRLYQAVGGEPEEVLPVEALGSKMSDPLGRAWGRRVRQAVENPDGSIVAAVGQIVTEREIARAIEHRQERALLEAVGCSFDEKEFQVWHETRQAQETYTIGSWFAPTSQSFSDSNFFGKTSQAIALDEWSQSEEIQNALGRPVMKEIRDRDDRLILDIGDLITYHAVQQAIQAEMLSKLLNSVYEF